MTKKIQVLGPGCPNCKKLYELTEKAVKELNLENEVEYINDIQKMIEMGVMQGPVLAINDEPIMMGPNFDLEKIKNLLKQEVKE